MSRSSVSEINFLQFTVGVFGKEQVGKSSLIRGFVWPSNAHGQWNSNSSSFSSSTSSASIAALNKSSLHSASTSAFSSIPRHRHSLGSHLHNAQINAPTHQTFILTSHSHSPSTSAPAATQPSTSTTSTISTGATAASIAPSAASVTTATSAGGTVLTLTSASTSSFSSSSSTSSSTASSLSTSPLVAPVPPPHPRCSIPNSTSSPSLSSILPPPPVFTSSSSAIYSTASLPPLSPSAASLTSPAPATVSAVATATGTGTGSAATLPASAAPLAPAAGTLVRRSTGSPLPTVTATASSASVTTSTMSSGSSSSPTQSVASSSASSPRHAGFSVSHPVSVFPSSSSSSSLHVGMLQHGRDEDCYRVITTVQLPLLSSAAATAAAAAAAATPVFDEQHVALRIFDPNNRRDVPSIFHKYIASANGAVPANGTANSLLQSSASGSGSGSPSPRSGGTHRGSSNSSPRTHSPNSSHSRSPRSVSPHNPHSPSTTPPPSSYVPAATIQRPLDGILLVFDISDRSSFEYVTQTVHDALINESLANSVRMPVVVLAGCKSDFRLSDSMDISTRHPELANFLHSASTSQIQERVKIELSRGCPDLIDPLHDIVLSYLKLSSLTHVREDEARRWAEGYGYGYVEVSSKMHFGVQDCWQHLMRKMSVNRPGFNYAMQMRVARQRYSNMITVEDDTVSAPFANEDGFANILTDQRSGAHPQHQHHHHSSASQGLGESESGQRRRRGRSRRTRRDPSAIIASEFPFGEGPPEERRSCAIQ